MRKEKSRSPPKLSAGRLPLILACLPCTGKHTDSQGVRSTTPAPLLAGGFLVSHYPPE